jgi:hypothetical protein
MKKIIVLLTGIIIAGSMFAQTAETASKVKTAAKYCCAKCDYCSTSAGTCPTHKTALVGENKYYCPMHADVTSDAAGKCPKCGMAMKQMDMTTETKYCCGHCDFAISPVKGQCPHSTEAITKEGTLYCVTCHDKGGKCSKCGMEMEKVEIKKKKA